MSTAVLIVLLDVPLLPRESSNHSLRVLEATASISKCVNTVPNPIQGRGLAVYGLQAARSGWPMVWCRRWHVWRQEGSMV